MGSRCRLCRLLLDTALGDRSGVFGGVTGNCIFFCPIMNTIRWEREKKWPEKHTHTHTTIDWWHNRQVIKRRGHGLF